jgi:hypothetical protein
MPIRIKSAIAYSEAAAALAISRSRPLLFLASPTSANLATVSNSTRVSWSSASTNVFRALQVIEDLEEDLDLEGEIGPERRKLRKAIAEFSGYLRANSTWIPNYGERQRSGETTSSAFAESTINQVVSNRMVKRQQVRWTLRGAHLLLQVRTRVLNDEPADVFHRWYPAFDRRGNEEELAA